MAKSGGRKAPRAGAMREPREKTKTKQKRNLNGGTKSKEKPRATKLSSLWWGINREFLKKPRAKNKENSLSSPKIPLPSKK